MGRTPGTGIPLNRALIDHNRERETRMRLCLRHDDLCGLVNTVVRTVPIDHDAIDTTADHVDNLAMNLLRIGRTVAHVHMVRSTEPEHEVCIHLGGRARVQQRVDVDLADIAGARISIALSGKIVRRARVIAGLRS